MPKFLEDTLKAEAAKKGLTGKRADHYVFGAMNNMGAMKGSQVTAKGEAMQARHDRDETAGVAQDQKRATVKAASKPETRRSYHGDGEPGQHWSGK